jgi:hypothetical protein
MVLCEYRELVRFLLPWVISADADQENADA